MYSANSASSACSRLAGGRRAIGCKAHAAAPWLLEAAVCPDATFVGLAASSLSTCTLCYLLRFLVQRQLHREADPRLRLWDRTRILNAWSAADYWSFWCMSTATDAEWEAALDAKPNQISGGLLLALASNTLRRASKQMPADALAAQ